MARRFEGKAVFITGASSGIGAGLARRFAQEGASVALYARRAEKLAEVNQHIAAAGAKSLVLEGDVNDRARLDAACAACAETFGSLDVCVANAGFGIAGPFRKLSTAEYRRQFETNFFGLLDTLYAAYPYLREVKGRIGLMGSVSGRIGTPAVSAYAASKFAVSGLADAIGPELHREGISVTLINPGFVDSEIRYKNNQGEIREGAKDPAPGWLVMPTDTAARHMVNAIYRRKAEAVITKHGKAAVAFNRFFPGIVRLVQYRTQKPLKPE